MTEIRVVIRVCAPLFCFAGALLALYGSMIGMPFRFPLLMRQMSRTFFLILSGQREKVIRMSKMAALFSEAKEEDRQRHCSGCTTLPAACSSRCWAISFGYLILLRPGEPNPVCVLTFAIYSHTLFPWTIKRDGTGRAGGINHCPHTLTW